jgi:hypothetical protein
MFSRVLRVPQGEMELRIDPSAVPPRGWAGDERSLPEPDAPLIVSVGRLERYKGTTESCARFQESRITSLECGSSSSEGGPTSGGCVVWRPTTA